MSIVKADELKALGNHALETNKFEEAVNDYTEAIKLDSHNHILFSNRSVAYAKIGKYRESLMDAEKAIEILKSDRVEALSRKGHTLELMKNLTDAVEAYEEALKYDPNNKELNAALKHCKENLQPWYKTTYFLLGGPSAGW